MTTLHGRSPPLTDIALTNIAAAGHRDPRPAWELPVSRVQRLERRLSTKLMSMISSYLTSVLRISTLRTTALAVVQASRLIRPSLLHSSSANERSIVAF